MEATAHEIETLELNANAKYVLIRLPEYTDEKERQLESGLYASFIYSEKETYAPVFGTIEKAYNDSALNKGDHVFFHYLSWGNAQHSFESLRNGHYDGTKMAVTCGTAKFLIMSESELFFAKRGDEYIALNDTVLLKAIKKDMREETLTDMRGHYAGKIWVSDSTAGSGIEIAETKEPYRLDIAEIVAAPPDMDVVKGDVVYPVKEWDVPLEYNILKTLGETIYYVNADCILGKVA